MKILSIQSSIGGGASVTRSLSTTYIEKIKAILPGVTVIQRDLATEPVPHLGGNMVSVQLGKSTGATQDSRLSDQLISELESCDVLVVGAPMYNFGIPSTIKSWFDHVIRAGRTFCYVDGKPKGLLPPGKKVIVFVASGGVYSEGPGKQIDFMEPHLRWLFSFLGVSDVEFVRAEGLIHGGNAVKEAMEIARSKALAVAAA